MKKPLRKTIEELSEEPYAHVICYPKTTKTELSKRLKELQKLGIEALEFKGEKEVCSLPVLGKGCVGIVTIAYRDREKVALKIRRADADRAEMQQEARMLRKANSVNVGPKLLDVSNNFLLMQFIDGILLPQWLEKNRKKDPVKKVLREILKKCWRLDEAGLDHGELSHAPKHVIIDKNNMPIIVDFETASINRKPSNVTSICQFLFISSSLAKKIAEALKVKDGNAIIEILRRYKKDRTRENFESILKICNV
jgi:putative serine/threonine protein kinase